MSSTPRVRAGAFPQLPDLRLQRQSSERPATPSRLLAGSQSTKLRGVSPSFSEISAGTRAPRSRFALPVASEDKPALKEVVAAPQADRGPVIPLNVIDAPAQRFYAISVYVALAAWKLYDWFGLIENDTESFWLFLKWITIDCVYLFGLPGLRIPWLDFSQPTIMGVYGLHMMINYMLMFNISLPWLGWLAAVGKVFYDREDGILAHQVKVSNIIQNSSLISGKQIINILPEGSAVLNPLSTPFCLGGDTSVVYIPLQFNSTVPIEVELVRVDLQTNANETIKMPKSGLKEVEKMAKRQKLHDDHKTFVTYDFPVTKAGVYRLGKVLDEYKLEVQRQTPDTFVVQCPKAKVASVASTKRCVGELSDLSFQVEGTPPLRIVYSRMTNGKDHSFHFQSLQPDGFASPLLSSKAVALSELHQGDVSWARSQRVTVSVNESMTTTGSWRYSLDEVHDAFGNVVKYAAPEVDDLDIIPRTKPKHLVQDLFVNERPRTRLVGCDMRNPLKVAKGHIVRLPINIKVEGDEFKDAAHTITWQFSPINSLTSSGDHGDVVETESHSAKSIYDFPFVRRPGLYTLKSVSCNSCEGEIEEPSSCMLINPLEPKLSLKAQDIPDECAGNSIGLRVDMDLVGTPPFTVRYEVHAQDKPPHIETVEIPGLRHQFNLEPKSAGKHKYVFKQIDDAVYKGHALSGSQMVLVSDVKPVASAFIREPVGRVNACLEEEVAAQIQLLGDAPFTLEYELLHEGRRKQERIAGIESTDYTIKTVPLQHGGEYNLALTSIKDKSGCRRFLKDELKIAVRRQRPKASFGVIENRRQVMTIANSAVELPLRLTGEPPWTVIYRNMESPGDSITSQLSSNNDKIKVTSRGKYELVEVRDSLCQGIIDPSASVFEVDWFPRPELSLVKTDSITQRGAGFVKSSVCAGDIDGFDVLLKGAPPYHVEYEVRHKPVKGNEGMSRKEFDAVLSKASIPMDTSKPGSYTYKFSGLADALYNSDKDAQPLVLQQRVYAKPSAAFAKAGQAFKYCMTPGPNEERIPITLVGVAPFSIDVEIRHHAGTHPETYTVSTIEGNTHELQIPRKFLKLGSQQVRIRSVRDANGCNAKADQSTGSVQVNLFDAPSIYPLETRTDYCVGDRIAYSLSGLPPFEVNYRFNQQTIKAKVQTTTFKRIAELAGEMTIQSVSDKASDCSAIYNLTKVIHPMPTVRISRGRTRQVDIHEGSEVEILFEFSGTPPFEFTYTRSTNAKKGHRSTILETKHDISTEHEKRIMASLEGTYEVVAIKDKYCSFSTLGVVDKRKQR